MALNDNTFSWISQPLFELELRLNTRWLALKVLFEATLETSFRNPRVIPYSSYQFRRWDEKMHSQTELDMLIFFSDKIGWYNWRESCRALKDETDYLSRKRIAQNVNGLKLFKVQARIIHSNIMHLLIMAPFWGPEFSSDGICWNILFESSKAPKLEASFPKPNTSKHEWAAAVWRCSVAAATTDTTTTTMHA